MCRVWVRPWRRISSPSATSRGRFVRARSSARCRGWGRKRSSRRPVSWIADAKNPLDRSAVHPESYHVVEKMAADLGGTVAALMADNSLRQKIKLQDYVAGPVGLPTLQDIMVELARPGRDPRPKYEPFHFDDSVHALEDVRAGMRLPGIVTNVTAFGAFVDIGVHQDGLVHLSQLADKYVKNASEVAKVQQRVMVTVLDVDLERKRISLSMRSKPRT